MRREKMTGSEKVFFDTPGFIYLIEDHPKYSILVRDFISDQISLYDSSLVSSLTMAEFLVAPKKRNNNELVGKFKQKLSELGFIIFDINTPIAELSAELRARYANLMTIDALQVSTALPTDAQNFLRMTHD